MVEADQLETGGMPVIRTPSVRLSCAALAVAAIAAVLIWAPASGAQATSESCGYAQGPRLGASTIFASHFRCSRARRFAARWSAAFFSRSRTVTRLSGYRCVSTESGAEGTLVRCRATGGRLIAFYPTRRSRGDSEATFGIFEWDKA